MIAFATASFRSSWAARFVSASSCRSFLSSFAIEQVIFERARRSSNPRSSPASTTRRKIIGWFSAPCGTIPCSRMSTTPHALFVYASGAST